MKLRWLALLLAMAVAIPAFAHGDKKHVVGMLEKVSADSVTVKTRDGKSVEVKLAANTVYVTKDDKPAKFGDLAAGQRVVVHATTKAGELVASEVKFAPSPAKTASQ